MANSYVFTFLDLKIYIFKHKYKNVNQRILHTDVLQVKTVALYL